MVTLALAAIAVGSQTANKPAVNLFSFLAIRFYEPSGSSMIDNIQLVFPPKTADGLKLVLRTKDGSFKEEKPIGIGFWPEYPAFANVGVINGPPTFNPQKGGEFVIELLKDGTPIGAMDYTVTVKESGDAFNPVKKYRRTGLWNKLGFFASDPTDAKAGLNFFHWVSRDELGVASQATVSLHVMNGAKEVATCSYVVGNPEWNMFSPVATKPKNYPLTMADLKPDGAWSIVLKHGGKAFRTYPFQVKSGKPVLPAESAANYEPRTGFLAPRMILIRGSQPNMDETFWVRAK